MTMFNGTTAKLRSKAKKTGKPPSKVNIEWATAICLKKIVFKKQIIGFPMYSLHTHLGLWLSALCSGLIKLQIRHLFRDILWICCPVLLDSLGRWFHVCLVWRCHDILWCYCTQKYNERSIWCTKVCLLIIYIPIVWPSDNTCSSNQNTHNT